MQISTTRAEVMVEVGIGRGGVGAEGSFGRRIEACSRSWILRSCFPISVWAVTRFAFWVSTFRVRVASSTRKLATSGVGFGGGRWCRRRATSSRNA